MKALVAKLSYDIANGRLNRDKNTLGKDFDF